MKRKSLLMGVCFIALTNIGFAGIPVDVTTVQKMTPVDIYFTGKVESVESGILSFAVDRGVVAETKKVGDIVVASVYNKDGSVAKKGTVVSKLINDRQRAAYQSALLAYQDAKDTYERDMKMQKSISKKQFETDQIDYLKAKADVLSKKADLDGTEIIAPYTGIITSISRGQGMGVGGPADDVAVVTRMSPMLVKIPFTSEIIDLVGKNNVVLVYSNSFIKPISAWVETADPNTLYAYVHNEVVPDSALLTPEQQKLPKAYMLFPVIRFYDENFLANIEIEKDAILNELADLDKKLLAVPARAVHRDDKGEYVWKAVGQTAMSETKGIDTDFTVEKVYIKTGNLKREFNYGANVSLAIVDIENSGNLKVDDVLVLYGDKSITNGSRVAYCRTEWLFLPGETVKVEIPALTKPGFYIPLNCIVHESEGFNFVYVVENGKAKLTKVKLTGLADETYAIEGAGIKEGTQLIVFNDKKQAADMYDNCHVDVKGIIPPCEKIQHQHADPIIPYDQVVSFF